MARATSEAVRRRRRRPEEAEAEILAAADQLLRERPFHEVTVGAIMERTTLSRKSFYVYFRDRFDLLTRLARPLRERLDAANAIWLEDEEDPPAAGRVALLRVAQILSEDGVLVRELADAARYDPKAERLWRSFNEPVIASVAAKIRSEIKAGRATPVEPEATARALVGMNLYSFFDQLIGRPDPDIDAIVDALHGVWIRVLYPAATT
jgi:AcrR family transcriptional regulator